MKDISTIVTLKLNKAFLHISNCPDTIYDGNYKCNLKAISM